jgi:flagellin-like protein
MLKNRKAISPVIATVILVAVAITVAVAVSYWMGGITSQYTKFEKVEIQSAQCVKDSTNTPPRYWTVTLTLKNSGSATATLNNVYINDQVATYSDVAPLNTTAAYLFANLDSVSHQMTIQSGQTATVTLYVGTAWPITTAPITSGTTIDIKIHSAGGMDYIKLISLA